MKYRVAKIAFLVGLLALLVTSAAAFQFKAGKCPEVQAIGNFEMEKVRISLVFVDAESNLPTVSRYMECDSRDINWDARRVLVVQHHPE